jgi:hypothetical protein
MKGLIETLTILLLAGAAGNIRAQQKLPVFTDVTQTAGIQFKHSFGDFTLTNIVEGTGAGACFFDYDGDDNLDIYFVNSAWMRSVNDNQGRRLRGNLTNRLYRNKGDGTFEDTTESAGVGHGGAGFACSAADYDNDGDLDLYVLNYGANVLYRNNGKGAFTDVTREAGVGNDGWSLSGVWFDYDTDGHLDLFVANYLEYDDGKFRDYYPAQGYPGPLSYSGQPDILYRSNGDGTFKDVTKEAGVFNQNGRAMSATSADLNNDGLLDLLVSNDAMENYYYQNTGDGRFVNNAFLMGLAFGEHGQGVSSMGPVIGDIDREGLLDVFIPDMSYSTLLVNRGDFFEDLTESSKLALICGQYVGWGGVLFDYDNDGYLDVFVANGNAHHEYPQEDVLVHNDGTGVFRDVAANSGPYFRQKYVGRGVAYGDYDNDGDVDLLVVNLNDLPRLLRNDGGNRNNWLTVDARLRFPGGERTAIGARVTVSSGTLRQIDDVVPVRGYLSQGDARLHFGLGKADKADLVEIRWPDGEIQKMRDVGTNQILKVVRGADEEGTKR